jgi:hypothetical protein
MVSGWENERKEGVHRALYMSTLPLPCLHRCEIVTPSWRSSSYLGATRSMLQCVETHDDELFSHFVLAARGRSHLVFRNRRNPGSAALRAPKPRTRLGNCQWGLASVLMNRYPMGGETERGVFSPMVITALSV